MTHQQLNDSHISLINLQSRPAPPVWVKPEHVQSPWSGSDNKQTFIPCCRLIMVNHYNEGDCKDWSCWWYLVYVKVKSTSTVFPCVCDQTTGKWWACLTVSPSKSPAVVKMGSQRSGTAGSDRIQCVALLRFSSHTYKNPLAVTHSINQLILFNLCGFDTSDSQAAELAAAPPAPCGFSSEMLALLFMWAGVLWSAQVIQL